MRDLGIELIADSSRVIARLFLPGEGLSPTPSRAAEIVRRIVATPRDEIVAAAAEIVADFADRQHELAAILQRNADTLAFRTAVPDDLYPELEIVLGAAFTAEHAVEAAALCNPSAVAHPDQTDLADGELRLAVALRAIGEGHVSSIAFASAVIGPSGWRFEPRAAPLVGAVVGEGEWTRPHFQDALEAAGRLNELSGAVVRALPATFRSSDVETAILDTPTDLSRRQVTHRDLDTIRELAWSAYRANFDEASELSQRVLQPATGMESNGMEDARFCLITRPDGTVEYRATYTAYDGRAIAPRLVISPDLRTFTMHRLAGPAAVNKGMALFPRVIGGTSWALTRTDGENISVARSADGMSWSDVAILQHPRQLWNVVQMGNCGSPLETDRGWLVLSHGVGPMRRYSIGALLLDLDDPTRVIARLEDPMLEALGDRRDGYVPNVAYSCGGVLHDGTLWLPYALGDQRVRAASIGVDELLDAMVPVGALDPAVP